MTSNQWETDKSGKRNDDLSGRLTNWNTNRTKLAQMERNQSELKADLGKDG